MEDTNLVTAIQRITLLQIGAASVFAMLLLCGGGVFSLIIIPGLLLWVGVTQWGLRIDRPGAVIIVLAVAVVLAVAITAILLLAEDGV